MATINGILCCLQQKLPGAKFNYQTVVKNKVPLRGLCITLCDENDDSKNIHPIFYLDSYLNSDISDNDAAVAILNTLEKSGLDIDLSIFQDKDYILEHLYLAFQRDDDSVTFLHRSTTYDDVMEYMYIRDAADDCNFSVKVTEALLNNINISEEEAWSIAEKHTASEIIIKPITQVISELTTDPSFDLDESNCPMYVVSNAIKMNGAAVITNQNYIKKWATERGIDRLVVIFSSIHEVLLLPASEIDSIDYINSMMCEVNDDCVDPLEQLANKAYIIDVNDIAA